MDISESETKSWPPCAVSRTRTLPKVPGKCRRPPSGAECWATRSHTKASLFRAVPLVEEIPNHKASTSFVVRKAVHLAAVHRKCICAFNLECSVPDGLAVIFCALVNELVPWDANDLELPIGHVCGVRDRSSAATPPPRGPPRPSPVAYTPSTRKARAPLFHWTLSSCFTATLSRCT